ncbi:Acetyltransferase (GNAT) family protein [Paenibacillus sp. UNCCL117]|uniref:GNAT family N-acetyltransferase n=1 Tax=unclassified Paenibacillus TaxID=185978 RepID=UPI000888A145|nr:MULTISPECIES: GNAT family N-acetyltransferase [unclassified Paenibacillus]SDE40074.1 Acetyltransferase (GNAT) family protein [Paenibacillus sp. cl123]SFW65291.1 Acetyltransferase (GNAT) family protein [Paenibacillus sp. UNCCL117]
MIRPIDLENLHELLPLLELQQLAYRIEAELIGFEEIPPLLDSPQTLRESGETFFGHYTGARLTGAVSCRQSARELTICRMMVHPDCFRMGIAGKLLQYVESLAPPGGAIIVSTGTGNIPAVALYEKHGFEPSRMHLLAPGITMTQFIKLTES